jgi:glycosyltransferase involved in cell wall biosynthesis
VISTQVRPRLGVLAPPWIPIPPASYGGIEQVVGLLCERLVARGYDVTLVAAPGSRVPGATVVSPLAQAPAAIGLTGPELYHALAGAQELQEADLILDHSGALGALLLGREGGRPVIHVAHGPLEGMALATYRALVRRSPQVRMVALSEAQRALAPDLPFAGVCPNGIDLDGVPLGDGSGGYLAFLGRMAPEKGAREAIEVARRCGRTLVMAAKCREPDEIAYFERAVAPHIGPEVVWLGEVGPEEKYALLGEAAALVFPISWPEPFGMVMIEAMACGTPVLATPCGSVPEVVAEGVSGVIRPDPPALAAALGRALAIPRRSCREHVARTFSADAMADGYERVMAPLLATVRAGRTGPR